MNIAKLMNAVADNAAQAASLNSAMAEYAKTHDDFIRERSEAVRSAVDAGVKAVAERDIQIAKLRQQLYEAEKLAEERLASIKHLQTRLSAEKTFNFASRYSASPEAISLAFGRVPATQKVIIPGRLCAKTFHPFSRDWFRAQDPYAFKVAANSPVNQWTWKHVTAEAAALIRSYSTLPIVRTVREWNLAAENLKNKMPERHGFRWTRSEEEKLVAYYRGGHKLEYFTKLHQRHPDAIVRRIAKLVGFAGRAKHYGWESEDDYTARLTRMYFPASYSRVTSILRKPGFEPRYTTYTG